MSHHVADVDERLTFTDRTGLWVRRLCVPIVVFWVVVAGLTNALVPQLEAVGEEKNVALSSPDSPSLQAFQRIGKVFQTFDSDSAAMVVLEGDQPLGADAHRYYDELVKRFNEDTKHVQHVQDFWGDPLTAAGDDAVDYRLLLLDQQLDQFLLGTDVAPDPSVRSPTRRGSRRSAPRG